MREGAFRVPVRHQNRSKQEPCQSWTSSPHLLSIPGVPDRLRERTASVVGNPLLTRQVLRVHGRKKALVRRLRTLLVNLTEAIKDGRLWRGWFPKQISPRAPLPPAPGARFRRSTIPAVLTHVTILQQAVMMVTKSGLPSNPQWMGLAMLRRTGPPPTNWGRKKATVSHHHPHSAYPWAPRPTRKKDLAPPPWLTLSNFSTSLASGQRAPLQRRTVRLYTQSSWIYSSG